MFLLFIQSIPVTGTGAEAQGLSESISGVTKMNLHRLQKQRTYLLIGRCLVYIGKTDIPCLKERLSHYWKNKT